MPIAFTFDEALHLCRHATTEVWIPSVTQAITLSNLGPNFRELVRRRIITREQLGHSQWLGKEVHDLTDVHDQDGEVNPLWLTDQTSGFLLSWEKFKDLTKFVPERWSVRRTELINGLPLTGESDKEGHLLVGRKRVSAMVDVKTGSSKSDSWGFQTNAYEMLKYRSIQTGREAKIVAHLQADGSCAKVYEYGEFSPIDGISYADTFLAGLHTVHAGIRRGNITEMDVLDEW